MAVPIVAAKVPSKLALRDQKLASEYAIGQEPDKAQAHGPAVLAMHFDLVSQARVQNPLRTRGVCERGDRGAWRGPVRHVPLEQEPGVRLLFVR